MRNPIAMTHRSAMVAEAATFSIVAVDHSAGEIGVAVASKFLAVGDSVPWAQAGVGGVATQAWVNVTYGPKGLQLLATGLAPEEAIDRLVEEDVFRDRRQVGLVDDQGRGAAWTGSKCMPWAGHIVGKGFTCHGNLLAGPRVLEAMAETFDRATVPLPERLLDALDSGQEEGGDARGQQAAALLVARDGGSYLGLSDRYIDLRVDDGPQPLRELRRLLVLHREERPLQSEVDAFVTLAHVNFEAVRAAIAARPILLHARASWEENAIEAAAHSGRTEIVRLLADAGARVDICAASLLGETDRVQQMLVADPSLASAMGAHGIPALYFAALGGHREIAEQLVACGATVHTAAGTSGPLHGAVRGGYPDLVAWFISLGADPAGRDEHGRTAQDIAVELGSDAVLRALHARP